MTVTEEVGGRGPVCGEWLWPCHRDGTHLCGHPGGGLETNALRGPPCLRCCLLWP